MPDDIEDKTFNLELHKDISLYFGNSVAKIPKLVISMSAGYLQVDQEIDELDIDISGGNIEFHQAIDTVDATFYYGSYRIAAFKYVDKIFVDVADEDTLNGINHGTIRNATIALAECPAMCVSTTFIAESVQTKQVVEFPEFGEGLYITHHWGNGFITYIPDGCDLS